jgi:hypothetical protein
MDQIITHDINKTVFPAETLNRMKKVFKKSSEFLTEGQSSNAGLTFTQDDVQIKKKPKQVIQEEDFEEDFDDIKPSRVEKTTFNSHEERVPNKPKKEIPTKFDVRNAVKQLEEEFTTKSLNKLVNPDDIKSLLSGNKPQRIKEQPKNINEEIIHNIDKEEENDFQLPNVSSKKIDNTNNEVEKLKNEVKFLRENIQKIIQTEVTKVLLQEVFNPKNLKPMVENILKETIEQKAKSFLIEAIKNKKS